MYLQNKYTTWYNNIINRAKSRELSKNIYTEKHHIIPKSIGGSNDRDNLVRLTAKEHRLVHILLPRMTINHAHTKSMWYALWMILRTENKNQQRKISKGSMFNLAKIQVAKNSSQLHKGKIVSAKTRAKMSTKAKGRVSPNKGKAMSDTQKQKMRDTIAKNGRTISPETVAKILDTRKNYKHSEETKQKISESNKGKTVVVSEETKQKISNSLKGRPNANKGKPAFNRGIPMSNLAKCNMQEGHKNREKILCPHCNRLIAKCSFTRWHGDNCKIK